MISIDMTKPINDLIVQHPEYLLAFGRIHFDTDFNQEMTLEEFCITRQLDPQDVTSAMDECYRWSQMATEKSLQDLDLPELIGYVLFTHHGPLKKEVPQLDHLADEALRVDGAKHPDIHDVVETFKTFKRELDSHMRVEERLFSFIILLVLNDESIDTDWKEIGKLTRLVNGQDEKLQAELDAIAEVTKDFRAPPGVQGAYRIFLRDMSRLEFKFRRHEWVENSILYPKVLALIEKRLARTNSNP